MPSRRTVTTSWFCSCGGGAPCTSTLGGTSTSSPICRIGVATMKMISSTSTTSTSGVMLISLRTPPPLLPPNPIEPPGCLVTQQLSNSNPMFRDLLARLLVLRQERDLREARVVRGLHHHSHLAVIDPLVRFQHHVAVRILLMFRGDVRRQIAIRDPVLSDEHRAVGFDRDDQIALFSRLLLRVRTFREQHVDALLQHRRDDHEDDEQHQADVDERRDVDVAFDLVRTTATGTECHRSPPLRPRAGACLVLDEVVDELR